jgi:hypothetical protein
MCDNKYEGTLTKDEVISRLAILNLELREKLINSESRLQEIRKILYRIGGPLNDNIKKYNKEQLTTFFQIAKELK